MKLLRTSTAVGFQPSPEDSEVVSSSETLHVAVGRSPEKTLRLLEWTFLRFRSREVVLVHIHRPSPAIPTPLGNLPADQANEHFVSAHRLEEWGNTQKILQYYLDICYRFQVQPNLILVKAEHVMKELVDLISRHGIKKLVIGAPPNKYKFFKVKGLFNKAMKNAPSFCEIWFVKNGKLVWVKEASGVVFEQAVDWIGSLSRETIRTSSFNNHSSISSSNPECHISGTFTSMALDRDGNGGLSQFCNDKKTVVTECGIFQCDVATYSGDNTISDSKEYLLSLPSENKPQTVPEGEQDLKAFSKRLEEIAGEAEVAKTKLNLDLCRRRELDCAISEAFNVAKASEASYLQEIKTREELEALLADTKLKQDDLVIQKNEIRTELQIASSDVAVLEACARQMTDLADGLSSKLDAIMSSIEAIKLENKKIQHQIHEYVHWSKRGRCNNFLFKMYGEVIAFGNETDFKEFSLSDLQTATFNFSDTFMIGQGGHGCVYKGEMFNQTVAIKRLHTHSIQNQREFQQEVVVLSKLRHPHLVTLIGACPEALSLVYEYLPNGTLHDYLIGKTMTPPLSWMIRTRIVAEISSVLLFLHTSRPEKILHGDLKPMNIFLDSTFNSKISGFGFCELIPDEVAWGYPLRKQCSHAKNPCGEFPYTDPECQRTGIMSTKSDIYSFGIIVLQLLTGKTPIGLASEVRRAVLSNQLSALLDKTAGKWPLDVAEKLAEFGLKCCEMNGYDRPELTPALVREFEQLRTRQEKPVPCSFLCPILKDIMCDPLVAADGFTYEGNAVREWLANGRETSPMTNLKLEHLNLIPNHGLRHAIQDWLCQSFQH
ncbi:hypothetical protein HPP92_028241 [Vanilla planifolia]|uniref:RING-type E3 ubiquitin transferase n=1 Tax=Vanilla planifolia TaxID=51239 RepID=A0A835PBR9_VANPL|nr:hypothetical protein HPP92_028241 [Vanilla planifolia]